MTVGLLAARGGYLAGRGEGQKRGEIEELVPDPGFHGAARMGPETAELLPDRVDGDVTGRSGSGHHAEDEGQRPEPADPGQGDPAFEPAGQENRTAEQPDARLGRPSAGEHSHAQVTPPGEVDRGSGGRGGQDGDRQEGERLGAGQRAEVLNPAERACPAQRRQASARVGDMRLAGHASLADLSPATLTRLP